MSSLISRLIRVLITLALIVPLSNSNITGSPTNTPFALSSGTINRVSVASDGTQGNDQSSMPTISAEGHMIAFTSLASNLVVNDTNGAGDVLVYEWLEQLFLPLILQGDTP